MDFIERNNSSKIWIYTYIRKCTKGYTIVAVFFLEKMKFENGKNVNV